MTKTTVSNVFWNTWLIGQIKKMRNGISFCYLDKNWSIPISRSMPVGKKYSVAACNFFENLLPEGETLKEIHHNYKIRSVYEYMSMFGGDCVGALSVSHSFKPETCEYKNVTKNMSLLLRAPWMTESRFLLPGAQTKLAVKKDGNEWFVPLKNSASSHILKSVSVLYPDLHYNEMFCMDLACLCGFPVPEHDIVHIGKEQAFLLERYDRVRHGSNINRIHQEDFCQALGASNREKSALGFGQCAKLLNDKDKELFAHMAMFNFLVGNCDAHAKNFALLYKPKGRSAYTVQPPTLAPFYDIVSTLVYPELNSRFAMSIGGERHNDCIEMSHWETLCQELKVDMPHVPVMEYAEDLAREHRKRFGDMPVYDKMLRIMESQSAKLASSPRMHACL